MTRPASWHENSKASASVAEDASSRTASPPPPTSSGSNTASGPDIVAEFLARKQAVLQTILNRFPALPQLIALSVAYCTVVCICIASLILLFVGSFVLTGQDRVVARFRQLMDAGGLGERAGAAIGWAMRAAIGLAATVTGTANGGGSGDSRRREEEPRNTRASRPRPSNSARRSGTQEHWQYTRRERPNSSGSTYGRFRENYSTGYARA